MVTAPSPFTGPTSERASPLNRTRSRVTLAPLAASVRVTVPSSMLRRSTDSSSGLKETVKPGARTRPEVSSPRLICGPARCNSAARHSPRINEPSANSTPSVRARIVSGPSPIAMPCNMSRGEGSRRGSMPPVTRTLTPMIRLASVSNSARWLPQSISNGPTSAVTSARMIAIANPSRVVCKRAPAPNPHPARASATHRQSKTFLANYGGKSMSRPLRQRDDLPGIHDVLRIDRPLDRGHNRQRRGTMLGHQIFHLPLPHPMLAGAGSIHCKRPLHQPFGQRLRPLHFVRIVHVDQQRKMKITVADMAYDRCQNAAYFDIALRFSHAFGQPRDGNANVGGDHCRARAEGEVRQRRMVARLPQPRALFRPRRPLKGAAAEVGGDFTKSIRFLGDRSFRAMKLKEQHRRLRQTEIGMQIARPHLQRIEQFNAGHRDAGLDRMDGGIAARLHGRKRTSTAGNRFRNSRELQRQLRDDPERAFRTDHESCEVVAGCRF